MIEFDKIIRIYSYQLQDIYCCDCFFERIASKLFSSKEFTSCDEFIKSFEEKFPEKKFVIRVFSGSILLVCNSMFKFILDSKKKSDQLMKRSCIVDFFDFGEIKIKVCIVCLIQIVNGSETLKKFKLKKTLRNDYIYM